jgi:nicotinamidase/pyrazinamidase
VKAGLRVLMIEDASAGIDVPAAGLYQDRARAEGQQLGIEYICRDDLRRMMTEGR